MARPPTRQLNSPAHRPHRGQLSARRRAGSKLHTRSARMVHVYCPGPTEATLELPASRQLPTWRHFDRSLPFRFQTRQPHQTRRSRDSTTGMTPGRPLLPPNAALRAHAAACDTHRLTERRLRLTRGHDGARAFVSDRRQIK